MVNSPGFRKPIGRLLLCLIFLFTLSACARAIHLASATLPASEVAPEPSLLIDVQQPEVSVIPTNPTQGAGPGTPELSFVNDNGLESLTTTIPDDSSMDQTPAPGAEVTSTTCGAGQCIASNTLILARPIAPPENDQVDPSYRFGSTQEKRRAPHHGVEFYTPPNIPVLAAAQGVVEVAGNDRITQYGPYKYFYGNLVILRHDFPPELLAGLPSFPTPVYTLYAHLSEISVRNGQVIKAGQEIGKVGMTGSATGNHLHFEVRLGENSYQAVHNPELWLAPNLGENSQVQGAIVGRVSDNRGQIIAVQNVTIQHLPDGPDDTLDSSVYINSYEEEALLGRPPWQESFALSGLNAGWYRVSFVYLGLRTQDVQVLPGQVTVVLFSLE